MRKRVGDETGPGQQPGVLQKVASFDEYSSLVVTGFLLPGGDQRVAAIIPARISVFRILP